VKNAKKTLKHAPKRNPEGTLPSEWKCKFHHSKFCSKIGHRDARSDDCCMHGKSKEEQDAAVATITADAIQHVIQLNASDGK